VPLNAAETLALWYNQRMAGRNDTDSETRHRSKPRGWLFIGTFLGAFIGIWLALNFRLPWIRRTPNDPWGMFPAGKIGMVVGFLIALAADLVVTNRNRKYSNRAGRSGDVDEPENSQ